VSAAATSSSSPSSLALHRRFGFREVGVLHEVGRKLGRYGDVLWMELRL
jgi:phosphinothricin acetyltransferase